MIILVTGYFPVIDKHGYPTGYTELLVSHGIDDDTGFNVVLMHAPLDYYVNSCGAVFDKLYGEWVLP